MISGGQLMYAGLATTSAALARLSRLSRCTLASWSALSTALTVFGFFAANSSVNAHTFSGWSGHIFWVVMAGNPDPANDGALFPGLAQQKPVLLSAFMLATICAGGI